jgi:hypothetical protein
MRARAGFIYIRGEFVNERQAVLRAIDEAYKAGWAPVCLRAFWDQHCLCQACTLRFLNGRPRPSTCATSEALLRAASCSSSVRAHTWRTLPCT